MRLFPHAHAHYTISTIDQMEMVIPPSLRPSSLLPPLRMRRNARRMHLLQMNEASTGGDGRAGARAGGGGGDSLHLLPTPFPSGLGFPLPYLVFRGVFVPSPLSSHSHASPPLPSSPPALPYKWWVSFSFFYRIFSLRQPPSARRQSHCLFNGTGISISTSAWD